MQALPDLGLDPERAALADELFAVNLRVHDRAMSLVGPMPTPPDLTMQQVRVLRQVVRQPGLSVHALAEHLGVSAPTASGLVDRLVDKGVVLRADDPADKRVRRVLPSETGIDLLEGMDSLFVRMMREIVAELSLAELEQFRVSMATMAEAMNRVSDRVADALAAASEDETSQQPQPAR